MDRTVGPKLKLTPERTARIVEAIENGATKQIACQVAGIGMTAFYDWIKRAEETGEEPFVSFRLAVLEAEGRCGVELLESVKAASKAGDWKAGAWLLERRYGYVARPDPEPEAAPPSAPDPRAILASLSVEVLEELLAARKASAE